MLRKLILTGSLLCLVFFQGINIFASGGGGYEYTRESILENINDSKIFEINSADYIFDYGIELIRAGMYEEAISKFLELRSKYPNELVSKMSYIYEGISLVRKSNEENNSGDCFKGLKKFQYILENFNQFITSPSKDLTLFYLELSKKLREIKAPMFMLKGYLEYSLIFFDDDFKKSIYPEIAYFNLLKGDFYSAISFFKNSDTFDSLLGLAISYSAVGEIDQAVNICENLLNKVNGNEYGLTNDYLLYFKKLKNSGYKKNNGTSDYSIDSNGNIIKGNYNIYISAYESKTKAEETSKNAEKLINIKFKVEKINNIFVVLSDDNYEYGPSKIMLESLITNGYFNAYIDNSSF